MYIYAMIREMGQVDLNRRAFLTTIPKVAVAVSTLANVSELSAGPQFFNPSNPLSGIIRSPVHYLPVSQRFPASLNFSSRPSVFGSPGFFYGGFRSSFNSPYFLPFPRFGRYGSSYNPYRNPSRANQGNGTSNVGVAQEPKFTYPIAKTSAEQAALEALYKDTANTLAQNFGYYERFNKGELINQNQHLLHYLTPIVYAHDTFNDETLKKIEDGLRDGNLDLIKTYGSLQFFKDAIAALEFNKIKTEAREVVGPDIEDLNRIIKELRSIEAEVQARLTRETGAESKFHIGQLEENAAFIVRAYHRLNDKKLTMIVDGLTKAVDINTVTQVTPEQRLYIEQFTTAGTREIIGKFLFLLLISILNRKHSDDKDSNGNKAPIKKIPELIKNATASNNMNDSRVRFMASLNNTDTDRSRPTLMTRLSGPEATEVDKLREQYWASMTA